MAVGAVGQARVALDVGGEVGADAEDGPRASGSALTAASRGRTTDSRSGRSARGRRAVPRSSGRPRGALGLALGRRQQDEHGGQRRPALSTRCRWSGSLRRVTAMATLGQPARAARRSPGVDGTGAARTLRGDPRRVRGAGRVPARGRWPRRARPWRHPRLPERDETELPFITIDPPGSMDLDQAMSIERTRRRLPRALRHRRRAGVRPRGRGRSTPRPAAAARPSTAPDRSTPAAPVES